MLALCAEASQRLVRGGRTSDGEQNQWRRNQLLWLAMNLRLSTSKARCRSAVRTRTQTALSVGATDSRRTGSWSRRVRPAGDHSAGLILGVFVPPASRFRLVTTSRGTAQTESTGGRESTVKANRAAIAAALLTGCVALSGCQSSTSHGSSGGSASGGTSGRGNQVGPPSGAEHGRSESALPGTGGTCVIGPHRIENLGGTITGTLEWECQGSVMMQLKVRLVYLGNNAERENEVDEGQPLNVEYPLDASPKRVTAPCTTGLWKMKIVGQIISSGAAPLTVTTTDKVNPPFNDPKWQTPIAIEC